MGVGFRWHHTVPGELVGGVANPYLLASVVVLVGVHAHTVEEGVAGTAVAFAVAAVVVVDVAGLVVQVVVPLGIAVPGMRGMLVAVLGWRAAAGTVVGWWGGWVAP